MSARVHIASTRQRETTGSARLPTWSSSSAAARETVCPGRLWGYDYETNTWTLFRVDPNPGYRTWSAAVFDDETGVAMLFGGAWYDADRRSQGQAEDMWTYRHEGG